MQRSEFLRRVFVVRRCYQVLGLGSALLLSTCAGVSTWFRPVTTHRGTAETFCGSESPESTAIIVAVYVEDAVENATIIVQPVAEDEGTTGQPTSRRESLYFPKKTATCVRVPLPAASGSVRQYHISVFGYAGGDRVSGGQIACEPRPVTDWNCVIK